MSETTRVPGLVFVLLIGLVVLAKYKVGENATSSQEPEPRAVATLGEMCNTGAGETLRGLAKA
ncbi:MAG: hypothetical protein AB7W28_06465 [Armatimonadota bacterium]